MLTIGWHINQGRAPRTVDFRANLYKKKKTPLKQKTAQELWNINLSQDDQFTCQISVLLQRPPHLRQPPHHVFSLREAGMAVYDLLSLGYFNESA